MPILPSALDKAFIDLVAHSDFGGSIDDRGMDCLWISNLLCPKPSKSIVRVTPFHDNGF